MATVIPAQEVRFIAERGTPEWHAAWRSLGFALAERGMGTSADLAQDNAGEVWQYLVSERHGQAGYVVHEFRHRDHPITGRREYLRTVCPA